MPQSEGATNATLCGMNQNEIRFSSHTSIIWASIISSLITALLTTIISVVVLIAVCKYHPKFKSNMAEGEGEVAEFTANGGVYTEAEGEGEVAEFNTVYSEVGINRPNTFKIKANQAYAIKINENEAYGIRR